MFAFTQVTALVLEDTSAAGFARAALVFALVWWAWAAYAWLTDAIDVENVATRLFIFGAMLGAFFIAISLPDAYTDEGAWFAVAYFVVRVLQIALYLWGVRDDPMQRLGVMRLAPWFLVAPTLRSQAASWTTRGGRRCGRRRSRSTSSGRSSPHAPAFASRCRTSPSATR